MGGAYRAIASRPCATPPPHAPSCHHAPRWPVAHTRKERHRGCPCRSQWSRHQSRSCYSASFPLCRTNARCGAVARSRAVSNSNALLSPAATRPLRRRLSFAAINRSRSDVTNPMAYPPAHLNSRIVTSATAISITNGSHCRAIMCRPRCKPAYPVMAITPAISPIRSRLRLSARTRERPSSPIA